MLLSLSRPVSVVPGSLIVYPLGEPLGALEAARPAVIRMMVVLNLLRGQYKSLRARQWQQLAAPCLSMWGLLYHRHRMKSGAATVQ